MFDQKWYEIQAQYLTRLSVEALHDVTLGYIKRTCEQRARVELIKRAMSEKGPELLKKELTLLEHFENCKALCIMVKDARK